MTHTPGNVDNLKEFDNLLGNEAGQVYADSAYVNKDNDQTLGKASKNQQSILHRAYRHKPLTKQPKAANKVYSSVHYIAPQPFGLLKLHHGLGQALRLATKPAQS